MRGISWLAASQSDAQEGRCIMEWVSEYSTAGYWSVVIINVFPLCMLESLVKAQDTARSLLHCSHSSHFLLRQTKPERLSYCYLMQPSDSLYLHKSCSLSLLALLHHTKTNTALLLAQWSFKPVHALSLSSTSRSTQTGTCTNTL